jgi:hypothetical protein
MRPLNKKVVAFKKFNIFWSVSRGHFLMWASAWMLDDLKRAFDEI